MVPKSRRCISPLSLIFRDLFPHTSTFYHGKTYKCQKPRFPTFFKKIEECIHTCTFYNCKTDKCAVTIFTIFSLKKKVNFKKPKTSNAPRHDFRATFASVGTLLVPLGSIWVVLVIFWLHFEFVTVPFRSLWLVFGSQISERTVWNTFSKAP